MPAARRYKQSLVDELKEAIRSLPPGEPPEPEYSTQEVLEQLSEELRRKLYDEHVDVDAIVDMLNQRGFKVKAREVRNAAQPKVKRPKQVAPAKGGSSQKESDRAQAKNASKSAPRKGSFEVRPDEDDV
jgi:alanyl-tRNA synthetase